MTDKPKLRSRMRAVRRDHVAELPDVSRALTFLRPPSPIAAMIPEGTTVGLYHALGSEAPTRGYAKWLLDNGRLVALPWFAARGALMEFRLWSDPFDDSDLAPGPYGAQQPLAHARPAGPQVVFVPLLAFTADGHRLGQGGGHYDRWLAAHPDVTAIGLGWDCQKVGQLPLEDHDRRLDAVVTPTRLYEGAPR